MFLVFILFILIGIVLLALGILNAHVELAEYHSVADTYDYSDDGSKKKDALIIVLGTLMTIIGAVLFIDSVLYFIPNLGDKSMFIQVGTWSVIAGFVITMGLYCHKFKKLNPKD